MLPITGYLERLSARPGERIEVKVSSQLGQDYRADLLRIRHADPNPSGPGPKLMELPKAVFWGTYPSRTQPVHLGSYGRIEAAVRLTEGEPFTASCLVWPTLPDDGPQALIATLGGEGQGAGFALGIGPRGAWLELGRESGAPARVEGLVSRLGIVRSGVG